MTSASPELTATTAINELRAAREKGGDWNDTHLHLLRRAVVILLSQSDDILAEARLGDHLRLKKTEAKACYIHVHSHSLYFFTSRDRAFINSFVHKTDQRLAGQIAEIIRERRIEPPYSQLGEQEFEAWKHGLIYAGYRGKFLALMDKDCPGRRLVSDIHTELNDYLEATRHLDRYLLH